MNIVNFEKYLLKNKINNDMGNHKNILDLLNINWRKYIKLNTKKYCKNCIFRNDKYELYIISWMPKQYTNLHSHPKNGCIMKILNGSLNEIRIKNNEIIENNYFTNQSTFMSNSYGKHIISNISSEITISLHLYSPPNFYN